MNTDSPNTARSGMPWRQFFAWSALPLILVVGSGVMILRDKGGVQPSVTVLVQGGAMHGVEGMDFGPDGQLYTASMNGLSVMKIDPKTAAVSTVVGAPDGEADDVAVGPAGTPAAGVVVWTAPGPGELRVLRPGGKPQVLMPNVPGINPVAFSKDGRLFAAQSGANDNALWEVDPMGEKPPRLVEKSATRLNGFSVGPDGKIYAPWQGTDQVVRIEPDSGEITVIAKAVGAPTAVDVDSKGVVYASGGEELWRIAPNEAPKMLMHINGPFDNMAIGPDDTVYASSVAESVVYVIDPTTLQNREFLHGSFVTPLGLAMAAKDAKEALYVADPFGARFVDPTTGAMTRNPWRRNRDAGIAVGANDKFTAVLGASGSVRKIDRATDEVVLDVAPIKGARGIVLTAGGDILVSDTDTGRLLRVDSDGTHPVAEGLNAPIGLALDGTGAVLVAESGSGVISRIDLAGGQRTELAKGLNKPTAVTRVPGNRLAVVETGAGTITLVDPTNGARQVLASGLALDMTGLKLPANASAGIAAGADGSIYATLPRDIRILKITLAGK
jgi:sugar lactone lactonase YvrE